MIRGLAIISIVLFCGRFKDSEQKKSMFSFKRGGKDRRRFLDTIIKRLHELAEGSKVESD
jgi:hypothetical protein